MSMTMNNDYDNDYDHAYDSDDDHDDDNDNDYDYGYQLNILSSVCIIVTFILIEILTQIAVAKIQSAILQNIVYWPIFICTRLLYCLSMWFAGDIIVIIQESSEPFTECIEFIELISIEDILDALPQSIYDESSRSNLFFCVFIWLDIYLCLSFDSKNCKGIGAHVHVPIRDAFQLIALFSIRSWDTSVASDTTRHIVPYRTHTEIVLTLDFDQTDDPTWPDRSLIHQIKFFFCRGCCEQNGLYLITTSLLRNKTWSKYLGCSRIADHESVYDINVAAIQSGGLILTTMRTDKETELFIYSIRNGDTRILDLTPMFPDHLPMLVLPDDGYDWSNNRQESSIYLRVIYHVNEFPRNRTGQCLLQVSSNDEMEKQILQEIEFPFSFPWLDTRLFRVSNGVGMCEAWESDYFVVYELKSQKLNVTSNLKPSLLADRPIRLLGQRYHKCFDVTTLEGLTRQFCLPFLDDRQAIIAEDKYKFGTTRFQPPTLKFICLKEVFRCSWLRKYDVDDWKRVTGVNFEGHF